MFLIQYFICIVYLTFLYKISRSERSFNNWLFDYIKLKPVSSRVKGNSVMYLLLSFEDTSDFDAIEVCRTTFREEILASCRLRKIDGRLENTNNGFP